MWTKGNSRASKCRMVARMPGHALDWPLLAVLACLIPLSHTLQPKLNSQVPAASPLDSFFSNAITWCNDTTQTPSTPVSPATVQCTDGLPTSINLTRGLDNQGLPIPETVSQLSVLTSLILSYNFIGGSLPSQLGTLTKLLSLNLQGNQISGSLPDSLDSILSLTSLVLSNNSFSGSLPAFLGTLDLRTLALNNNLFSGTVPALSSIQTFNLLDLSNNLLYGVVSSKNNPACSGNLDSNCFSYVACEGTGSNNGRQLFRSSLACNDTCLSAGTLCSLPMAAVVQSVTTYCSTVQYGSARSGHAGLACLYRAPFLLDVTQFPRTVQIFSNLGLSLPDSLSLLTDLAGLVLNDMNLGGTLPEVLTSLQGLVLLSLSSNKITGSIPSWLSSLAALTELNLDKNQLTGTIPDSLALNTNLGTLQLQYNRLYGTIPSSLVSMPKIVNLQLNQNQLAGEYPLNPVSAKLLSTGGAFLASNFLVSFTGNTSSTFTTPSAGCSGFTASSASNCFTADWTSLFNCPLGAQRDLLYGCRLFCNTTGAGGTCGGNGYCYLDPGTSVATCDCFQGFKTDPTRPGTCIPGDAPTPSPPPPSVTVERYFGYNLSTPSTLLEKYLNRWSRHLSRGYANVNGAPAWNVLSIANWIAEENQFAPNTLTSLPNKWGPATDQGNCSSCYANAVADSVASAVALRNNGGQIPDLTSSTILRCGLDNQLDEYNRTGCAGGITPNAFDLVVEAGIRESSKVSLHPTCPAYKAAIAPFQIIMYEKVQFSGWFGLLLTVGAQPAVVTIQASYVPFQLWTTTPDHTNVFLDSNCYSGVLDHTVLIVGYQLLSPTPYWIIRNSWGSEWGDNGYIRMGIQGATYSGICGVYVYPAFYPIPAPRRSDPCYITSYWDGGQDIRTMSPCGGGRCTPNPAWGPYSYTCDCSELKDFVAVNNTVRITALSDAGLGITQTCAPLDACRLSLYNPCGVGTCVNDGAGGFVCICPLAYIEVILKDGRRVCSYQITELDQDPDSVLAGLTKSVAFNTSIGGLSCYEIYVSYGLSQDQFELQNPGLDCSVPIPAGVVLNVSNPAYPGCETPYTISKSDKTCADIAGKLGVDETDITKANPGLDCTNLIQDLLICAVLGSPQPEFPCLTQYQLSPGDTCSSIIQSQFALTGALRFYTLNAGINCDLLAISAQQSSTTYGQQFVCLAYSEPGTSRCPKPGTLYPVKPGDTCISIQKKTGKKITPASFCTQPGGIKGSACLV